MKIQVISDIHADMHPGNATQNTPGGNVVTWAGPPGHDWFFDTILTPTCDVLVIAGDLGEHEYLYNYLCAAAARWKHVVYVTGNHEYWSCDGYRVVKAEIDRAVAENPNIHWLLDSAVEIEGQRFIGGTLWYPRTPQTETYMWEFRDFKRIKGNIRDPWMFRAHAATARYLRGNVQEGDVVVTHHAPCSKSVPFHRRNDPLTVYYWSDQTNIMFNHRPALWVHGHIHTPTDYEICDTRVYSNPFGYVGYETINLNSEPIEVGAVVQK